MGDPEIIARRIVRRVLTEHACSDEGPKGAAARAELDRRQASQQAAAIAAWENVGEIYARTRDAVLELAQAYARGMRRASRHVGLDEGETYDLEQTAWEVGHG